MKDVKMIFGPPGTGKTYTLLNILEKELQEVSPDQIAFVSFTRKGSYEGKARAKEQFGFKDDDLPYFRTLHSMAFKELGLGRHDVIDRTHYKEFSRAMGMHFVGYYTEDLKHNDDAYLFFDLLQRNNSKSAKNFVNILNTLKLKFVQDNYKRFKSALNIVDYTDMIQMFVDQKRKVPVKVAIVDEAQDLTTLQWQMVLSAFRDCDKLYLAGDDDQAIYEWNGADVEFFLNFKGADINILNKSYRLPDNIVAFANKITNEIKTRIDKKFTGTGKQGEIKIINDINQLSVDNYNSWLFLSRNNYFLKVYKSYFEEKGIVYNYKGEPSVKQSEVMAIKNFTAIQKNKQPIPSSLKMHLKPDFDLNKNWYDNFKWNPSKLNYYRNIIKNNNLNQATSNISIETIHSIKGGEAENVVIMEDITSSVKKNYDNNPDCENRIFYTGVTRTKNNLYILQNSTKNHYNLRGLV